MGALLIWTTGCTTQPLGAEMYRREPSRAPLQVEAEGVAREPRGPTPTAPHSTQEAAPPNREVPRFLQWKLEIEPIAGHYFETGLSGGDAHVTTSLAGLEVKTSIPLSFQSVMGIQSGHEWRDYDFDGTSTDLPGNNDPLKNLQTTWLTLTWLRVLGKDWQRDWQFYGRGTVQGSVEDGASFGDGISFGGLLVFGKAWSKELRLGFGLGAFSQLEDETIPFPAVQFVWTPSEKWRVELIGPKLEIERYLAEKTALALIAEYDLRGYRLREGDPTSGGVLTDERVPLTLRLTQGLGEYSHLRIYCGIDLIRRLDFADSRGDQLDRASADPAPTMGAALLLGF